MRAREGGGRRTERQGLAKDKRSKKGSPLPPFPTLRITRSRRLNFPESILEGATREKGRWGVIEISFEEIPSSPYTAAQLQPSSVQARYPRPLHCRPHTHVACTPPAVEGNAGVLRYNWIHHVTRG